MSTSVELVEEPWVPKYEQQPSTCHWMSDKFFSYIIARTSWPLCCLFFDLRILITSLVSSNSSNIRWDEMIMMFAFVLDQLTSMDFYTASTLKQHSAGRHVTLLGHSNLIPSQHGFFFLSPWRRSNKYQF